MAFDVSTLLLQAVNFLVLMWLLQRFLYRPVLAALDRRREAVLRLQDAAREARTQADAAEAEWHRRQVAVQQEAEGVRRQAEAAAMERRDQIMVEARGEAEQLLNHARRQIASERAAAAAELRHQGARLAADLAGRLLAAVAPGTGAEPFLASLEAHWQALPGAERRRLLALLPQDAVVRVEIMPPPAPPADREWAQRLTVLLDGRPVTLAVTPELIAGVRVVLPGAALGVNWGDAVAEAQQEMERDVQPS